MELLNLIAEETNSRVKLAQSHNDSRWQTTVSDIEINKGVIKGKDFMWVLTADLLKLFYFEH